MVTKEIFEGKEIDHLVDKGELPLSHRNLPLEDQTVDTSDLREERFRFNAQIVSRYHMFDGREDIQEEKLMY
jgi:hypothetical protein